MIVEPFKVACLQVTPTDDLDANLRAIANLVAEAVSSGAEFVALPEYCSFLVRSSRTMAESAHPEASHPALRFLRRLAGDHGIWLLIGSVLIRSEEDSRPSNSSYLISPTGGVVARYDKIHMFDVTLPDGREIRESAHYRAGRAATLVRGPFGSLGLTVCYDVRFPQLYRAVASAGAEILAIPAAFSAQTGPAHWEPLLKARAIENGSYVLAPATVGDHPGGWKTHGHSMIIDPWGVVLAEWGEDRPGIALATVDLSQVARVRSQIPSLASEAGFTVRSFEAELTKDVEVQ